MFISSERERGMRDQQDHQHQTTHMTDWAVIDVPSNPTLISANPHKTQSTNGVIMSPLWTLLQIDLICQLYCSITCHTVKLLLVLSIHCPIDLKRFVCFTFNKTVAFAFDKKLILKR